MFFFWKACILLPLFSHISRLQILRKGSFQKEYTVRPPSFPHFTRKLMISKFGSSPLSLGGWIFQVNQPSNFKGVPTDHCNQPKFQVLLTTSPHWKDASLGLFPHHAGDPLSCSPPVFSCFFFWCETSQRDQKVTNLNLTGILVREVYDAVCYCSKPKSSQGQTGRNISDTWTTNIYKWKNSGTSLNKLLILAKNDQNSVSPALTVDRTELLQSFPAPKFASNCPWNIYSIILDAKKQNSPVAFLFHASLSIHFVYTPVN